MAINTNTNQVSNDDNMEIALPPGMTTEDLEGLSKEEIQRILLSDDATGEMKRVWSVSQHGFTPDPPKGEDNTLELGGQDRPLRGEGEALESLVDAPGGYVEPRGGFDPRSLASWLGSTKATPNEFEYGAQSGFNVLLGMDFIDSRPRQITYLKGVFGEKNVTSHKDTGEIIFKHKGKWRALKDDKSMGLRDIGRSMLLKGLGGMWPGVAHSAEVIIAILSKKYARKPLAQPLGKIGLAPGSTWNKAASQAIGAAAGGMLGEAGRQVLAEYLSGKSVRSVNEIVDALDAKKIAATGSLWALGETLIPALGAPLKAALGKVGLGKHAKHTAKTAEKEYEVIEQLTKGVDVRVDKNGNILINKGQAPTFRPITGTVSRNSWIRTLSRIVLANRAGAGKAIRKINAMKQSLGISIHRMALSLQTKSTSKARAIYDPKRQEYDFKRGFVEVGDLTSKQKKKIAKGKETKVDVTEAETIDTTTGLGERVAKAVYPKLTVVPETDTVKFFQGSWKERSKAEAAKLLEPVEAAIPFDGPNAVRIMPNNLISVWKKIIGREPGARFPDMDKGVHSELNKLYEGFIKALSKHPQGGLTYGDIQSRRKIVGEILDKVPFGAKDEPARVLYKALVAEEDRIINKGLKAMIDGGNKAGADRVAGNYARWKAHVSEAASLEENVFSKIGKHFQERTPEKIQSEIITGITKNKLKMIKDLRRNLDPDTYEHILSNVIDWMAKAKVDDAAKYSSSMRFDINSFLAKWDAMHPDLRKALFDDLPGFGKEHYNNLTHIAKATRRLSDVMPDASTDIGLSSLWGSSASGRFVPLIAWISQMSGASTLLSSPRFVSWIAGSLKDKPTKIGQIPKYIAGLVRFAQVEKDSTIKQELLNYINHLDEVFSMANEQGKANGQVNIGRNRVPTGQTPNNANKTLTEQVGSLGLNRSGY